MTAWNGQKYCFTYFAGNGFNNTARDLVLNFKNISDFAVEALSPDVIAAFPRIDELDINPQTLVRPPGAAFENIFDAQIAGDLTNVRGLALVGEGRVPGDDEEAGHIRQIRDDVLGQPVSEELLLGIALMLTKGRTAMLRLAGAAMSFSGRDWPTLAKVAR